MQVIVETRDPQGAEWRSWSEQRVRFAMRRLQALVPMAKVSLSDVAGGHRVSTKRCQIQLRTDKQGLLVVEATAEDWRSALDNALGRAVHALTRSWQRIQKRSRARVPLSLAAAV
ncbi:HPF/RaiA family ribosome-associated protein [Hydrogenophaga aquatica]